MTLTPLQAHVICLLLFVVDLGARALRIRAYVRGVGGDLGFWRALELNAWGDAGAGLTPMRFGGEISRLAGLLQAGVAPRLCFLAIGFEVVVAYPVVFLLGGWLFWRYAPDWWRHVAPQLQRQLAGGWPWLVAVIGITLLVWVAAWRWRRAALREPDRGLHRVRPVWRTLPWWPVAVGIPTSLVNVAGRTLMLPVLALTLPEHPPFGVLLVGSFVLLYSQLLLPTPAGAGAVDLAFLGGAAGDLGGGASLLLAWRFYSVGAGALLGVGLAVHRFGIRPLRDAVARAGRSRPA